MLLFVSRLVCLLLSNFSNEFFDGTHIVQRESLGALDPQVDEACLRRTRHFGQCLSTVTIFVLQLTLQSREHLSRLICTQRHRDFFELPMLLGKDFV